MTATRETFGDRLRQELERAGVSQRELAARLGGSREAGVLDGHRSAIRKHLIGKHAPRRATRIAYAEALGLDRDHFEDDDDEEADRIVVSEPVSEALLALVLKIKDELLSEGMRAA